MKNEMVEIPDGGALTYGNVFVASVFVARGNECSGFPVRGTGQSAIIANWTMSVYAAREEAECAAFYAAETVPEVVGADARVVRIVIQSLTLFS